MTNGRYGPAARYRSIGPIANASFRDMSLYDEKSDLRRAAAAARAAAHAARAEDAARALAARFLDELRPALTPGAAVSLFRPMREEIDVGPLTAALDAQGLITALPVMDGRDAPLAFRSWKPGEPLVPAHFGIEEPADGDAVDPAVIVVPLLAFDAAGNRLGYGGGYYDRTLAHYRARGPVLAVGVAYDEQEVPRVPVHGGDQPLDLIVTDRRTIRPRRDRNARPTELERE